MRHYGLLQCIATSLLLLFTTQLRAGDLDHAEDPFEFEDGYAIPVDFQHVVIRYEANQETKKATATATVEFDAQHSGYPRFDLVPSILSAKFDGVELLVSDLPKVSVPGGSTSIRVLKREVEADTSHVLQITYKADFFNQSASSGHLRAGFFMSDLKSGGRGFFEQYGPAGFEWDHYKMEIHLKMLGFADEHKIYANGDVGRVSGNEWLISYPDYYSTSSFFFHISEKTRFKESATVYKGIEKDFPVVVYSASGTDTKPFLDQTLVVLKELEATYGAWTHNQLVIYAVTGGGGMEYCGATMTSMYALEHEITHSWFARGVMPANGNAGFIDEAIASWRDGGYVRASSAPNPEGIASNLGGFSQYRRDTTYGAYTTGRNLISKFDKQFEDFEFEGQQGMRGVLRALFSDKARQTLTVSYFKEFIEDITGSDLTAVFDRHVYGRGSNNKKLSSSKKVQQGLFSKGSMHPRPFTEEELIRFR